MSFRYGLECLFRFYSYGLEQKFRPDIYRDFTQETIRDVQQGELYGLEKFWVFLKYYKHSRRLEVDSYLRDQLKKYKKLNDFMVDVSADVAFRNISDLSFRPDIFRVCSSTKGDVCITQRSNDYDQTGVSRFWKVLQMRELIHNPAHESADVVLRVNLQFQFLDTLQ
ncbi:unnamed protein product [Soboliphyme baturini]|uniref:Uncharacterized protein n=1 Tax=Soboliphyme baturini TaxID=241478 RepID=A0A3P8E8H0_9BILA|nr:unnamed protein product [Soboliphyme baturini]